MKYDGFKRLMSVVLMIAMLVQLLPLQCFATENEEIVPVVDTEQASDDEQPAASVVGELTELRTEEAKHFRLSDGSNIAVNYGVPVHYQDEGGNWTDINNQPVMAMDGDGTTEYQIANGDVSLSFAGTLDDGVVFTASCSEGSVSVSVLDITQDVAAVDIDGVDTDDAQTYDRNVEAELISPVEVLVQETDDGWLAEDLIPETLESEIVYEDVFPGVDLRYTTYSYHVKEEIVVRSLQTSYRYDFLLSLDGMTAQLNEDGSVSLLTLDDNQLAYSIPTPCMTDAAGVSSGAVSYALTPAEDGVILTVTADENWINSSERELPVMIDPTLRSERQGSYDNNDYGIYARYVKKGYPNASNNTGGLYVGYSYDAQNMEAYLYVNTLPEVPEDSVIVGSWLYLYRADESYNNKSKMSIGLYPVTETVPSGTTALNWLKSFSWNTKPEYDDSNVIDFVLWNRGADDGSVSWDVTELAKQWYTGSGSRAVALVPLETHTSSSCSWQYFTSNGTSRGPMLVVAYRSCYGIEPYYTYQTLGAGAAGTAYIADATGQLKVTTPLVGYASSVNPVSLNLIYNSDKFAANSTVSYNPPSSMGLNMKLGFGWTLDCIQRIDDITLSDIAYKKYTDGDGTEHYFAKDTQKDSAGVWFYDEDGLGLKIKKTGDGAYTMSDDNGNTWLFTNNLLTSSTDSDGNKIYINYNDSKRLNTVTQINDGCEEVVVARFTYDEEGKLVGVTDAAGRMYTLVYTSDPYPDRLSEIKQGNTVIARYSYLGHRVRKLTDVESGYSIYCDYDSNGRISKYQELVRTDGVDTAGGTVAVSYPHPGKTIYRDYGADRKSDEDASDDADDTYATDDIITNYLFDGACRTINVYTTTNGSRILGASNAAYAGAGGTDKKNNRTARTASIGAAVQQLIRNTGFESEASGLAWTLTGMSVSTDNPRTGNKSLKGLPNTDNTHSAKRMSTALTAGVTYTFSAYVCTKEVKSFDGKGIYLRVTDPSGNSWTSSSIDYATPVTVDSGWVRINVTFTAQNASSHTLSIVSEGVETGSFYIDDVQLERTDAPSNYNLVDNGGMQLGSVGWTMGSNASIVTNSGNQATVYLKIQGNPTDNSAYAWQDIPINLSGRQTYVLSGWGKANAVPDTVNTAEDENNDSNKQFGLRAVIYYTNGDTEYHYTPFSADSGYWQFTSLTIVPKKPNQTVEKIRIYCTYQGNANVAWFDNISLLREVAQTMKYDDDGNLTSVTTTGLSEETSAYDDNNNLIKTITGGSGTYEYSYDNTYNKHQLTGIKLVDDSDTTVLTQSMVYDGAGNVTSSTLSGTGKYTMTTSAVYTGNKNRLYSMTDATGATVTYGYATDLNKMLALPNSVTNEKGTKTRMEYDSFGRNTRTSIVPLGESDVESLAKLEYNYSNGNLASIVRTDNAADSSQTYNFTYDAFGNMTEVRVGTKTLATYEYADGNGLLEQLHYANGHAVSYTYDNLGRTKTVALNDDRTLTYSYSGDGQLSTVTETGGAATVTYVYNYDSIGRLVSMRKMVGDDTLLLVGSRYNSNNQLTRNSWRVGAAVFSQDYTYNSVDGSINTVKMPDQYVLTMGYDSLRRLSTVTSQYTDPDTGAVTDGITDKRYLYRTFSDNTTTSQVTSLKYTKLNQTFQYTYDELGNIATYAAPEKSVVTYTYDDQGQLLKAVNDNTEYTYTYDNVGNILTAFDGSIEHTYGYGTNNWKDLLISYDGQTITYDAIGNPTSYYNGTRWNFTWQNGRQLATASDGTSSISYAYDGEGIRTSKTVDGVEHTYYYSGGKLLRETYGSNILDFAYNADGSLYSFRLNGTYYYYVTNLQGDVIGLVDANEKPVASYEYDPYGKVISATETLADINPMRYRGYYYDTETGLYYLQSRYYDPEIGRWINADDTAYLGADGTLLSYNLFAYCKNNPIMGYDPSGHFSWTDMFNTGAVITIAALAVIAIVGSGGAAAPPLLAAASALVGTTVTAAAATTVATGVAITGVATMGAAATASILESSNKQGKDYVQAKNNKQANQWAQEVGYDGAEELKADYVGKQGSKFNMYTDRATGQIILIALKTAKEIVTELFRW